MGLTEERLTESRKISGGRSKVEKFYPGLDLSIQGEASRSVHLIFEMSFDGSSEFDWYLLVRGRRCRMQLTAIMDSDGEWEHFYFSTGDLTGGRCVLRSIPKTDEAFFTLTSESDKLLSACSEALISNEITLEKLFGGDDLSKS